jgi:hypothetical protein
MARTVEFYIDRANAMFEAGFTSKAGQRNALDDLNRAHDLMCRAIQELYLAIPHANRTEAQTNVYWGLADLHVWKAKHSALVLDTFPEARPFVEQIEALVELRLAIKAAEVVKAERKEDVRVARITKSIRDEMELRKAQYARGLELHDLFNGLPVYANVHMVTNQHGTTFLRAFYYMAGVLTPLNVILAVLDEKQEK